MSRLITLQDVSLAYGLQPLLDNIRLEVNAGERICLIGRNGTGKSSLMKVIEGAILPDSGSIWRKPHLRIARLAQELPSDLTVTVYAYVAEGLAEAGQLLSQYYALTHQLEHSNASDNMAELQKLQTKIDAINGWQIDQTINQILTRLELPGDQCLSALSGGWQRRAALAKALVASPELLLLDEPTNHLDIAAIQWLEEQLLSLNIGILFITHDRSLLRRLATRILELDRGQLTSWTCGYDEFLQRKEAMLQAEEKHHADFDKKLAEEERWIRQGIKARRTRNEGRVRALKAMRRERAERLTVQGKATFDINKADSSGQLVIEAKHIEYAIDDKTIVKDFSTRIMRCDKIGLIGPNGVGKTTLLTILLDKLTPQQGTVTLGTKLKIAYFDQLRAALAPDKTVMENVAEGRETIEINGQQKHVISYLNDFLFTPARAMTPVKALSGGECNRLLLARLFSQPANLLVLDEPTNDLDIETLELLEAILCDYQGTLLIVSHDRAFLDNVVTSTIVFEGDGKVTEYVGGYTDWMAQRPNINNHKPLASKSAAAPQKTTPTETTKKLSYKEQRELAELPAKIEALEKEQASLHEHTSSAEFYKQDADVIAKTMDRLQEIEIALTKSYIRWDELDNK